MKCERKHLTRTVLPLVLIGLAGMASFADINRGEEARKERAIEVRSRQIVDTIEPVRERSIDVRIRQVTDTAENLLIPSQVPASTAVNSGEQVLWRVISGGGGKGFSTGIYLNGTLGQSAVERGTYPGYAVRHGFWQLFTGGGGTCCIPPTVGDVDQSGGVDITDVSVLIDNQFLTLTPLVCDVEGDVDFSGMTDITDLSILIDNQFLTLTPLLPCP
ncbi:MAG: hypothetical protein GY867_01455 [bacterium]|nr:hypothetical protein [bacterium]